jgi:amino-acid N-acetyltransferase
MRQTKSRLMTFRIVSAEASQLEPIRHLLSVAALPLDGLEEQFPDAYAVALRGAELVGVAGVEQYGADGLLRSVAVIPAARGSGIGRALIHDRLEFARRRNLRSVWLLTTTAAELFETLGFSRLARSEVPAPLRESVEFAKACPESALCLTRSLGP